MNKIAFLFLTQKELTQEMLWENFFDEADPSKYNIYVHSKPNFEHNFLSSYQINSLPTRWSTFSILQAQQLLINCALEDSNNTHLIFVSETTIPINNFDSLYDYLYDKSDFSFLEYGKCVSPYFLERKKRIKNILNWTDDQWFISSQWVILNFKMAEILKKNFNILKEIFQNSLYSDEHCYPSFYNSIGILNDKNVINKNLTYVDWSKKNGTNPSSFKTTDLTREFISELKNKKYFFIRKVLDDRKILNLKEFEV